MSNSCVTATERVSAISWREQVPFNEMMMSTLYLDRQLIGS